MIAGRLALTMAAIAGAGIVVHGANATQLHAVALSYQLTVKSIVINEPDSVTAQRLAVGAWGVLPCSQIDSVMTALLTEQQETETLLASSPDATGVAFSSDGKLLAGGYRDGTVRLWDLVTDKLYGSVFRADSGSQGGVNGVAFSPDGSLLASADANGTVRMWHPATGQLAGPPLQAGSAVNGVAFSPDGSLLASADANGTVRMWHPATGQLAGPPLQAGSAVNGVAFSPDGSLLASADANGIIQMWHPATGQPAGPPQRADSGVNGVAFSPDGSLLASADADGIIRTLYPATDQTSSNSDWFIILASVIAIALSGLAVTITARQIRLARRGPQ